MKKTIVLVIGALLLIAAVSAILIESASKPDYHNKITGRYVSTQYRSMPMNDSIRDVIKRGLIWVDSSHADNPLYYDSLYKVAFTPYQRWQSGHKGFLFSGIAVFLIFFVIFAYRTSIGDDSLKEMAWLVPAFLIGCPLIGAFYYYNPEKEISKRDYNYYWSKDGDLKEWWNNGFKAAPPDPSFQGEGGWISGGRGDSIEVALPIKVILGKSSIKAGHPKLNPAN